MVKSRPFFFASMILLSLISVGKIAFADDAPNCEDSANLNQQDMNMCAEQDFQKADRLLNKTWPEAKSFAEKADQDLEKNLQGYAKALLDSQRAWLAYRDAQCVLDGFGSRGGSMEPMLVSGCKATMTNERVKEFRAMIDGQ